jgi:hypothetical protein
MVENYCRDLYSKEHRGNYMLELSKEQLKIQMGPDEKGFPRNVRRILERRLETRKNLPADLQKNLEAVGYFEKLEKYLNTATLEPKNLRTQMQFAKDSEKIAEPWVEAFEKTYLSRVVAKYPKFLDQEEATPEEYFYQDKMNEELGDQLVGTAWATSPEWKKVKSQYAEIVDEFVNYLKENKDLSADVKKAWLAKIRSVKLVLPDVRDGSACGSSEENAFYNGLENTFTVCVGLLTSLDDFRSIISHELAHALGPNFQNLDQQKSTKLFKTILALKKEICENAPLGKCPKNFAGISTAEKRQKLISEIKAPKGAPESFYDCIRYKSLKDSTNTERKGYAEIIDRSTLATWSDEDVFLSLTKPTVPTDDGKEKPNFMYQNPCGKQAVKASETHLLDTGVFFTASYLCSDKKDEIERLSEAQEQTSAFTVEVSEKIMDVEGRNSEYSSMLLGAHSEIVRERFADAVSSGVYARWLKKHHPTNIEDRRQQLLASISYICSPLSLRELHPREAQWQKVFSYEPHSANRERRLEFLKPELRDVLACTKDHDRKDCVL